MSAKHMITPTWTLRLKFQKVTVLVEIDPLDTLEQLKRALIEALQNVKTPPSVAQDRALPMTTRQVRLALPRDPLDAAQGWNSIDYVPQPGEEIDELSEQLTNGKGKGKARVSIVSSDALGPLPPGDSRTLREAGIKDNYVVAFTWTDCEVGEDGQLMDADEEIPEFEVTIPTMEDIYGVQSEGDLGVLKEYRG